jgi:hypothetical protein
MALRNWLASAGVAALLAAGAVQAANPATFLGDLKAAVIPGEVMLSGDDRKIVYDGGESREYRICVKAGRRSATLRVTADAKEWTLHPGDCDFVRGRRISATPAQPLHGNSRIVATFQHEKALR